MSGRPGAEGADAEAEVEESFWEALVLEVLLGWEGRGAIRRDCDGCQRSPA